MAVARNHAIDHYRRGKQEQAAADATTRSLLETMPARDEHPIAGLEREERARLVHSGLRALPPDLRAAAHPVRPAGTAVRGDRERARDPPRDGEEPDQPCPPRAREAPRSGATASSTGARREGMTSMDCQRAEELLSDHLEGSLHEILRAELEAPPRLVRGLPCPARGARRGGRGAAGVPRARGARAASPSGRRAAALRPRRRPVEVRPAFVAALLGAGRGRRLRPDRARHDR